MHACIYIYMHIYVSSRQITFASAGPKSLNMYGRISISRRLHVRMLGPGSLDISVPRLLKTGVVIDTADDVNPGGPLKESKGSFKGSIGFTRV